MKKYKNINKLSNNRFLNLFKLDALTDAGKEFEYYFVSRRKENALKMLTKDNRPEGVVIYPIWKEDASKIVMIRQYRYPLDDYLYELPAGLIDEGEEAFESAIREMKEETGLTFEVYHGGLEAWRKPFYMGAGFTDESCSTVYGYATGEFSNEEMEETESIQVLLVDKQEAARILKEEKVSIRAAYLLMQFLKSDSRKPFDFLG